MTLPYELTTGPLAAELAPLIAAEDDAGIYAVLYRKDRPGKRAISSHDINAYLFVNKFLFQIENGVSEACKEATKALQLFDSFDMRIQVYADRLTGILDGLIAEPFNPAFTVTDKTAILAISDTIYSRIGEINNDLELAAKAANTDFVPFLPTVQDIYAARLSSSPAFTVEIISSVAQSNGALLITATFTNQSGIYTRTASVFQPTTESIKQALLREQFLLDKSLNSSVALGAIALT